jgi:hypothetical protein
MNLINGWFSDLNISLKPFKIISNSFHKFNVNFLTHSKQLNKHLLKFIAFLSIQIF